VEEFEMVEFNALAEPLIIEGEEVAVGFVGEGLIFGLSLGGWIILLCIAAFAYVLYFAIKQYRLNLEVYNLTQETLKLKILGLGNIVTKDENYGKVDYFIKGMSVPAQDRKVGGVPIDNDDYIVYY
jgi:hypothetical protein